MKKLLVGLVAVLGVGVGGLAMAHYWGHGGYGYGGYGHHMMGPGYGGHLTGPGYGGYCWQGRGTYQGTRTVTEKEAASIVRNYIGTNPNLQAGEITDQGTHFEGEIVTKEGSLVSKLAIDKDTGLVHPLY